MTTLQAVTGYVGDMTGSMLSDFFAVSLVALLYWIIAIADPFMFLESVQ